MKSFFLALAVASTFATAADVSAIHGKWQVHQSIADNESDQSCTFTQKGNDLTGSCVGEKGPVNVTGKVDGKKVMWVYKSEYNGSPITLTYKGNLDSGSKMTGAVTVEEYNTDGTFTATQAK